MGNCTLHLADGVTLIASDDTWIEGNAIQQLQTTATLPGMRHVAGMPDLHPGRGYPVGAPFFSVGCLYPALIGNDIGCGMALWATDLDANKANLDKLEKRLGNLDVPLDDTWREQATALAPAGTGFDAALGTIGGGNHFAELQRLDTIHDTAAADALGLNARQLLLLVHSGSRGLGQAILDEQLRTHGHDGLPQDSPACAAYLARHDTALRFAKANRELIARRMLDRLHAQGKPLLDVHHNLVTPAVIKGERGWLHRKGATPLRCRAGGHPRLARRFQLPGRTAAERARSLFARARRRPQMDAQRVQGPPVTTLQSGTAQPDPAGQPRDLRRQAVDLRRGPRGLQADRERHRAAGTGGAAQGDRAPAPGTHLQDARGVLPMILLQFSSAQGPAECELAVVKALACLLRESARAGVRAEIVEQEDGEHAGTLRSALVSLEGDAEADIAQRWEGTIQWTCPSPYRPRHARKNWFFGVARCAAPAVTLPSEIRFETTRASGPGGQHVNKTESAVRAIHVATGISVKVQTERSQHANKRLAVLLLAHRLASHEEAMNAAQRAQRRTLHHQVERGNPRRVFKGERFEPAEGG